MEDQKFKLPYFSRTKRYLHKALTPLRLELYLNVNAKMTPDPYRLKTLIPPLEKNNVMNSYVAFINVLRVVTIFGKNPNPGLIRGKGLSTLYEFFNRNLSIFPSLFR